jgi:hypothetical protein
MPSPKPMERPKPKGERYGWSISRILAGYTQHISAVAGTHPKGFSRPGADIANKPRQCFEFLAGFQTYDDQLMRTAFGSPQDMSREDWLAVHYFRLEVAEHLRENPWEPDERLEGEPAEVEFVKLSVAAEMFSTDARNLRNWIDWGMPHIKRGNSFLVQLKVAAEWTKMKHRHKIRKHLTRKENFRRH